MTCAVHPESPRFATCAACKKELCAACATHTIDGRPSCAPCAEAAEARAQSLGGVVIAATGAAYLVFLAAAMLVVPRARVFGAGLAAVLTIAFGRVLQTILHVPAQVAPRRSSGADDAADPAG